MISTVRASRRLVGAGAAAALLASALATSAVAGHGAVSYENPMKAAERKRREKQAELGEPATAPAAAQNAVEAVEMDGDRDHAFAKTVRRQLSDVVKTAERQIADGTDSQLKVMAKSILEAHRAQIAELDRWLAAHPQPGSTP